jgi:hypothetical protein
MEPKPVYKIRKNGKQDVFEGTIDDVRKWLRQNSITSSDEMRRAGYAVLELDEFWGLVSDFPELAMTEREGRGVMLAKMRSAKRLMLAAVILLLSAVGIFAYDQWLPKVSVSLQKSEYENRIADKERIIKDTLDAKGKEIVTGLQSLKDVHKRELESLNNEHRREIAEKEATISDLKKKLSLQQESLANELQVKEKEAERKIAESLDDKKRADDAELRAAERGQVVAKLTKQNSDLTAENEKLKNRKGAMPIAANLERKILGGYKLHVWNFSSFDYTVQVVVKGAASSGKTYTKSITINPLVGTKPGLADVDENIESGDTVFIKPLSEEWLDNIELSVPE